MCSSTPLALENFVFFGQLRRKKNFSARFKQKKGIAPPLPSRPRYAPANEREVVWLEKTNAIYVLGVRNVTLSLQMIVNTWDREKS